MAAPDDGYEMREISIDEIAELVVRIAMRWLALVFAVGVTLGLVVGVLL